MSLTITAARWANPDQTRALVTTTERGAVLLKPERTDEWAEFQAWIAAGGAVAPFAASPGDPARAYYRKVKGVLNDLPPEAVPEPGVLALRLVAEMAKELETANAPMTGKLRALVARIRSAEAGS